MSLTESISPSSERLVCAMEQTLGRPLAPAVREAFLHVPRYQFVLTYYDQGQRIMAPAPTDEVAWEAWCMIIAQDEALTTQVDADGLPTSSSSQPSVMAVMLEQGSCWYRLTMGRGTAGIFWPKRVASASCACVLLSTTRCALRFREGIVLCANTCI